MNEQNPEPPHETTISSAPRNSGQRNYAKLAAVCVGGIVFVMTVSCGVGVLTIMDNPGSDFAGEVAIINSLATFGVLLIVYLIVVAAYVILTRK